MLPEGGTEMDNVSIVFFQEDGIDAPILIEGLPGIGHVGKLATTCSASWRPRAGSGWAYAARTRWAHCQAMWTASWRSSADPLVAGNIKDIYTVFINRIGLDAEQKRGSS